MFEQIVDLSSFTLVVFFWITLIGLFLFGILWAKRK